MSVLRSSFYGMSMLGREEDERFKNQETEQEQRGAVVAKLNIKNILELTHQDREVLDEIKKFMSLQAKELQSEIEIM